MIQKSPGNFFSYRGFLDLGIKLFKQRMLNLVCTLS